MTITILQALIDNLWEAYRKRVSYAQTYVDLVKSKGGTVGNDHIAFRTFNTHTGSQPAGIEALSRIFVPFGYVPKREYLFTEKKLKAWHYEHPVSTLPKLFISQLEVNELPSEAIELINDSVSATQDPLSEHDKTLLAQIAQGKHISEDTHAFAKRLAACFGRPWPIPKRSTILAVDKPSQYAAWTLLHGNSVNHFTAYINNQNVKEWPDIEATIEGLRAAGVPMKTEIEGEPGSKLRQSSTQAVSELCDVMEDDGSIGKLKWSYAYYELAERNFITGPDGKRQLFTEFLGEQATNLFEMTKTVK